MAASTIGKPVCPSHQAAKRSFRFSHSIRVVLPAERALGDVRKLPEDLLVEVAPDQLRDEHVDLFLG